MDRESHPRYRRQVGPASAYDLIGALQFNLLTALGLRETHYLLDVGCGSLRAGRLFIPYLLPGRYFGIEPVRALVEEGIDNELGRDILLVKEPTFEYFDDFRLSAFGQEFDFVLAQSVFTHAAPDQIRTCLAEAKKVLRSDGTMVANFHEGEESYTGTTWAPERADYRLEFMEGLADDAGLELARFDWPHPSRHAPTWVKIRHS